MSETFVHVAPRDKWRPGLDEGPPRTRRCARRSTEIPGVSFNFSGPIKDNVEEAVSGVRGQVVLKIFGTDLDVMKTTLEQCVAALGKVPGIVDLELYRDASVPQLQIVLDRGSLARAGINVSAAQDVVADRARRQRRDDVLGERAPGAGAPDLPGRGTRGRSADRQHPRADGQRRTRAAARGRPHREGGRQGRHHARGQQPRPGAQVQRRRPRPGLGRHRRASRR